MDSTLTYAAPEHKPSRLIAWAAHLSMLYPLLCLLSLYGQWLLSAFCLGHLPRPSLDDPKMITGADWMHSITFILLLGLVPMAFGAVAANTIYAFNHPFTARKVLLRSLLVVGIWVTGFLFLRWDPAGVLYWWLD